MPFPWRRTFLIALGFFGISLVYYRFGASAGMVGPLLAGLLIDAAGTYRSVFLFGPVFMTLALILILPNRGGKAQPAGVPVAVAGPAPSATGG